MLSIRAQSIRPYTTQRMLDVFLTQKPINRSTLVTGIVSNLMRYQYSPSKTFEMVQDARSKDVATVLHLRGVSSRKDALRVNAFRRALAPCNNHVLIERPCLTNLVHRVGGISGSFKKPPHVTDTFSLQLIRPHHMHLVPVFAAQTCVDAQVRVHSVLVNNHGETRHLLNSLRYLDGHCANMLKFVVHGDKPLADPRFLMDTSHARPTPTFEYLYTVPSLASQNDVRELATRIFGHLNLLETTYGVDRARDVRRHWWRAEVGTYDQSYLYPLVSLLLPLQSVIEYRFILQPPGAREYECVLEYSFSL
jgi:hypothetical protein